MTIAAQRPLSGGERWAEQALADLRASRYSPAGWVAFLRRSLERAVDDRRRRPALARQAHVVGVTGMAAWAAAGPALRALRRRPPPTLAAAVWWGAVCVMLRWHLGMVEGPRGERRERLSAADILTLGRLWTVPMFLVRRPRRADFAVLAGLCGLTDLADGRLARRAGTTRLGASLDQTADVATSVTATSLAARAGWLGRAPARLVAGRAAGAVLFACWYYFVRAEAPPRDAIGARWTGPVLCAGLLSAASRQRRTADHLMTVYALGGAAPAIRHATALRRGHPNRLNANRGLTRET